MLVVADPTDKISEIDNDALNEDNVASFLKPVIGVVTHGFLPGGALPIVGGMPNWVLEMSATLSRVGYIVVPFDWSNLSNRPIPGRAILAGDQLAQTIRTVLQAIAGPADVHFIGHSRGAVVVSQALQILQASNLSQLNAGYVKMTFLDPHPAHNQHTIGDPAKKWYSFQPTPVGAFFALVTDLFQLAARDPEVFLPGTVDQAEVFYQNTPFFLTPVFHEQILNLWGEIPVPGATHHNLSGLGMGHSEVPLWYLERIPTLLTQTNPAGFPAGELALSASAVDATPQTQSQSKEPSGIDPLYPALVNNRGIANAMVSKLDAAMRAFERGQFGAAVGGFSAFVNHVQAQRGKHIVLEAADVFIAAAQFVIDSLKQSPNSGSQPPVLDGSDGLVVEALLQSVAENSPSIEPEDDFTRIANLRGDSPHFSAQRANGNVFLKSAGPAATVFDDGERDRLTGSSGCDWFFAMLGGAKDERDKLTDLLIGELVDELI